MKRKQAGGCLPATAALHEEEAGSGEAPGNSCTAIGQFAAMWTNSNDILYRRPLRVSVGEGENPLSRHHFIPEASSPWRVVIKQEQSRPLQNTVDSKPFVIFPPRIQLHIVCLFNIFTAD